MPTRIRSGARRTPSQAASDRRTAELAGTLGRASREARRRARLTQTELGVRAGVSASTISKIETGHGQSISLLVWTRIARAAGTDLRAYLDQTSAAGQPRDLVHLRNQELVIRSAAGGGWQAHPEAAIDPISQRSRSVDVLLTRPGEVAILEIYDWFDDVGAASRDWDRRLAGAEAWAIGRLPVNAVELPRVSGCWVIRATTRNRQLVRDHGGFFAARFPGSSGSWLRALSQPNVPIPRASAMLWASVDGARLIPARRTEGSGQRG